MPIGLWLLWRAVWLHTHDHDRSGLALAFVMGLVPCSFTSFSRTCALVHGALMSGLVLSGAFAAVMILTVAACPLRAVLLRTRFLSLLAHTAMLRMRAGQVLEAGAALVVILLGLRPLIR